MLFEENIFLLKLSNNYSLAPMNNLSILKPTFLLFFFFMLHLITIVTSAPRYTPSDDIALCCGISGSLNSPDGRQWTGDVASKFEPILQQHPMAVSKTKKNDSFTASSQKALTNTVPYKVARISRSQFTYMFQVTPGQKFIRLHFFPTLKLPTEFDMYKDFFTVKAGPFILLENFSASSYSKYQASFFKEYCLNVEEGVKLNITFTPSSNKSYAFINGIEIVSMPTSLYYTPDNESFHAIDQNDTYRIENSTALEMIYRFNVGGKLISPVEDTGMYRKWFDDDKNMWPAAGVVNFNSTISLTWSEIPAYTAPDDVYRTARSMGTDTTRNSHSNLTWLLFVDSGFWHLVRLHFCEIYSEVMDVNERRFRIYIDNKTAEEDFDIMRSSGGKGIPMYVDYAVMTGNNIEDGEYSLFIALHPNVLLGSNVDVLLNGIEVFKLSNHGNLAVPNPKERTSPASLVQPSNSIGQKSKTTKTLIIAGAGSAVGLLIVLNLLCCMVIWQLAKRKRYGPSYKPSWSWWWLDTCKGKSRTRASWSPDELCRHFSLAEIKAATNNFQKDLIIGVGGFGNVYKGFMEEGSKIVAIKRFDPESSQGDREFRTEIEMLSQLRHVHLVSLIGYCNDKNEMILVYDFMMNGTLRDHLYDTKHDPLPWKQRLKICKGAAIGLHYLHTGLEHTIIHRDVKTTNILLDEKWTAKVSDFGLSKMDRNNSLVSTAVKGTWGYLDPEYARGHLLTEKSDVYSFGVVLFEVLCARKAVDRILGEDQLNLVHWARKCIHNGTFYHITDPYLMGKIAPECFKVFLEIAESCVREEGVKRPTMNDVMEKLKFALELQEKADAEKERTDPSGEYMYPAISFHVARYDNVDGRTDMDPSVCSTSTTIDTNTTGMSSTSYDSRSATVVGETSNSKGQ